MSKWKFVETTDNLQDTLDFPSFEHSTGTLLRLTDQHDKRIFDGIFKNDRCVNTSELICKLHFGEWTSYGMLLKTHGIFDGWRLCDSADTLIMTYNRFFLLKDQIDISVACAEYALQWAGINRKILRSCLDAAHAWLSGHDTTMEAVLKAQEISDDCSRYDHAAHSVTYALHSISKDYSLQCMSNVIFHASQEHKPFHLKRLADTVRNTVPFYDLALRMVE